MFESSKWPDLCCPKCQNPVTVVAPKKQIEDYAVLTCGSCKFWFPVINEVPVMILFSTPLHRTFEKKFASAFADTFRLFSPPNGMPEKGEESTQRTFSEEWDKVELEDLSFTYDAHELKNLHQNVWLKWPSHKVEPELKVLNVGCGIGNESLALSEITGGKVTGVDLNLSVLRSGKRFAKNPQVRLLVASLFHLPFAVKSFDLVYSQGVIHHTFSTHEAFQAIAKHMKPSGELFIWIYALEDHLVMKGLLGLISRLSWSFERLTRPMISALPSLLRSALITTMSLILHPLVLLRVRRKSDWKFRNTQHALRDAYSPRYAHRHGFNEVIEWLEDMNLEFEFQSPKEYRRLFNKRVWGIGFKAKPKVYSHASPEIGGKLTDKNPGRSAHQSWL